jgi:hypothetical protein
LFILNILIGSLKKGNIMVMAEIRDSILMREPPGLDDGVKVKVTKSLTENR